jgi:hypothetical protein
MNAVQRCVASKLNEEFEVVLPDSPSNPAKACQALPRAYRSDKLKAAKHTKGRSGPSFLYSVHNHYCDAHGQASNSHNRGTTWASRPCRKQTHPSYRRAPTPASPGHCRSLQQRPKSPCPRARQHYIRRRQCHSCPSWPCFQPSLAFVLLVLEVREEHREVRRR